MDLEELDVVVAEGSSEVKDGAEVISGSSYGSQLAGLSSKYVVSMSGCLRL